MDRLKKYLFFYISIIVFVTFIIYSNTLHNEFQLDDNHVVLNNEKITDLNNFADIDGWKKLLFNRQLALLTVAVNYSIHQYDVFGYHLFNIFIHIFNALLIFWLIQIFFKTPVLRNSSLANHKLEIALFTSLLFAAHPLQIQAVGYITQRMVSLAFMFYLVSCILFLIMRIDVLTKGINWKTILLILCIIFSFQLGNYSKEIAVSLPLSLLLIEIIFIRKKDGKPDYKIIALFIAGIIIVFTAMLIIGLPKQSGSIERDSYFYTQINVLVTYIQLLFLPIDLHVYYDFRIASSFWEPQTLLAFLFLLTIFLIGIIFHKKHPVLAFAVFWFYITQIIESSIFPLQHVIFEYRLYPSLVGFSFLITYYSFYFSKSKPRIGFTVLVVIVCFFSVLTYQENKKWKNGESLWSGNIEKAPNHPKPYNYLGYYLLQKGEYHKALPYFTKSIRLDSNYTDPLNHRGIIYKETGRFNEALNDFSKAIKIKPDSKMSYNNRGYAFQAIGEYDLAVKDFKKAIELDQKYHNAIKNLSVVLQKMNRNKEALEYAKNAVNLASDIADYFNNRGNAYYALGHIDSAETDFRKSIVIDPDFYRGWNNIGVVLMKREKYTEAIEYLTKAIELKNNFVDAFFNRAFCFYHIQKPILSLNDLQRCFELNPSHQGAIALYNKIYIEYTPNKP